jgi:hypothetical protein
VAFLEGRLARALALFGLDRLARELGIPDDVIRRVFRSELTPSEAVLQADTVAMLTDLARAGREDEFRWLARSQGARAEELDALWTGTVARARRRRVIRSRQRRSRSTS